jgi:hypothetical protein
LLAFLGTTPSNAETSKEKTKEKAWSMNATAIEACSCPDSCRAAFGAKAASKDGEATKGPCRFNAAYKINKGTWGTTKLDGAKFWIYGDLDDNPTSRELNWIVVTFDLATGPEQREAIFEIAPRLFPMTWKSFKTAVGDIQWVADKSRAYALLDTGKTAEVRLGAAKTGAKEAPAAVQKLTYWGSTSNSGFAFMPATVSAVRRGETKFEYKGATGFMVTFDIDSKSTASANEGNAN